MKKHLRIKYGWLFFSFVIVAEMLMAGPYTESGVNGYIDNCFRHANPLADPNAVVNPIFRGWATGYRDYLPADEIIDYYPRIPGYIGIDLDGNAFYLPEKALGPATGDIMDVVSLGDLSSTEIANGKNPGEITLIFGDPDNVNDPNRIRNQAGYDFAVFENGFVSDFPTDAGTVSGQMFAELAYVEVSSDGQHFIRFPTVSLTPQPTGATAYLTMDITDVYNFAGKHPNAYGTCVGTPFDLEQLADHNDVLSGRVDLNNIVYVRIVDVPGSGDFYDAAMDMIDPNTYPNWDFYANDHPVYDAWLTWGSGGLDLEAVGVLNEQQYAADINLDGIVDADDLIQFMDAWLSHFGQENWIGRCDLAEPKDLTVNIHDFAVFSRQWHQVEQWRHNP